MCLFSKPKPQRVAPAPADAPPAKVLTPPPAEPVAEAPKILDERPGSASDARRSSRVKKRGTDSLRVVRAPSRTGLNVASG